MYCNFYLVCKTNINTSKIGVELLRSKFKRSTQKSSFMLTENDLGVKVDIKVLYVEISHLLLYTGL
jgi:hypothetical protein